MGSGPHAPALELQKPFGGAGAAGAMGMGPGAGGASAAGDTPALHSSSKVGLGCLCVASGGRSVALQTVSIDGPVSAHVTCIDCCWQAMRQRTAPRQARLLPAAVEGWQGLRHVCGLAMGNAEAEK